MTTVNDERYMKLALNLGQRGQGNVWPNPAVGCVIVKNGRIVGRGWTQPGGRPHAEVMALREAGTQAHSATAYVTLEPCAHHGATGPCVEALVAAGIRRCVVAVMDPDLRASGPSQLIQSLPYLFVVIVLAGFVGKAIPPRAGGQPYVKER